MPRRIGANPPPALGELRGDAWSAVLAASGVPPSLFRDVADGTAQREAFRRFLTSAVEPLTELVAEELAAKLNEPVTFAFEGLYAHDLAGRAQAFKRLARGGVDVLWALRVAGLETSGVIVAEEVAQEPEEGAGGDLELMTSSPMLWRDWRRPGSRIVTRWGR